MNIPKLKAKVVELIGIKKDISRQGNRYTLAEMQFSFIHKGKTEYIIMSAFNDIALSLKYFEKGSIVELEFCPKTKFYNKKPVTYLEIEKITRIEVETEEDENT